MLTARAEKVGVAPPSDAGGDVAAGAPEVDATARVVPVPSATNLQTCRMLAGAWMPRRARVAVMPILATVEGPAEDLVNVGDPPALPGRPSVFDVSGSNVRNSPREPLKHHAGESSMNNYRSLNHTKWECQYHVVFIPKYRRKTLYGGLRHYLGDVLRRLAEQRESRVEEGHLLADHVHMLVSIPPKYSVAQVIGYIKGKSAIHIAREFAGRPGTSWGNTSGHGATTSRRSGRMNESCGNTSSSRNAKTGGWSNYGWRSSHL